MNSDADDADDVDDADDDDDDDGDGDVGGGDGGNDVLCWVVKLYVSSNCACCRKQAVRNTTGLVRDHSTMRWMTIIFVGHLLLAVKLGSTAHLAVDDFHLLDLLAITKHFPGTPKRLTVSGAILE
eukprot:TCALIF_03347-PB protein Name:"Protein of unknown function" AED:0.45 eAED:1.00 QI:0/0/0/1/0/0/3/0/124